MVEMRDPYTANHQQRVSQLLPLSPEMNFSEEQVEYIRIALEWFMTREDPCPTDILSRTGLLNEFEWEIMKTMSRSYDILKILSSLAYRSGIALQHHERLNGSGYPHALKEMRLNGSLHTGRADSIEAITTSTLPPGSTIAEAKIIYENREHFYDHEVLKPASAVARKRVTFIDPGEALHLVQIDLLSVDPFPAL